MKKTIALFATAGLCLSFAGCSAGIGFAAGALILALLALGIAAIAGMRLYSLLQYKKRRGDRMSQRVFKEQLLWNGLLAALGAVVLFIAFSLGVAGCIASIPPAGSPDTTEPPSTTEPIPEILFQPQKTSQSDPANWGITWEIFQNGTAVNAYQRTDPIQFGQPEDYFTLPGIGAFRGNNYRNSATYGTAEVESEILTKAWSADTSTLSGSSWSGSGWTGQPLIVKWDDATRKIMNLYPDKQDKTGLVEVIYATLDGNIYFLDLEDGSATRDPIHVGMCFKGAGSLDPRGYPLMYVGSGDTSGQKRPRMFIISLIDGKILFEHGYEESLSLRKDNDSWCAFDSSPLIHGATDTLIWPGESGILYTMKLNTAYDPQAGTISIAPNDMVCTRYNTRRSGETAYWYGYEASVNIVENYLYVSENGGMFYCIDLNTMELVWAQDTKDDSNSTPVFEPNGEDGGYIYTAPSLHWTKNSDYTGQISIYKLDAITGQIIWEKPYQVNTVDNLSGGVQSSPLLGKPGTVLEGMILYSIARTPGVYNGILVALDTQTGEEIWRLDMNNYSWSSPVAVYEPDGNAYVILCESGGYMFLVDAQTGESIQIISLGGNVEASPAVYEDTIVVGTRTQQIFGIQIE